VSSFEKIFLFRHWKDHGLILSHMPLREDQLKGCINAHGHIHQNPAPSDQHRCLCVEQTGWGPVHIEEVRRR
jgi:hypothetical protein